jgi:integrase
MLKEENVRTGFIEPPQFKELLKHLARHLHPLKIFLYTTGARVGMAAQITWDMVSTDCRVLHIPAEICKNREPLTLALTSELVALLRKHFRKSGAPAFDATNLRREWERATAAAKMPQLLIHDLRRSGARNLRSSGVAETVIIADRELESGERVPPLRHRRRGRHQQGHGDDGAGKRGGRRERLRFD